MGHFRHSHRPVRVIALTSRSAEGQADFPQAAGTIPYELLCAVGERVERLYV